MKRGWSRTEKPIQEDQHAETSKFLVLHAVRIKGTAAGAGVAVVSGLQESDATSVLRILCSQGMVYERGSDPLLWSLSNTGREYHRALISSRAGGHTYSVVAEHYDRFIELNPALLDACTAWQLRHGKVNDHLDSTYDQACIARLSGVNGLVQPICKGLREALDHFGSYGPRLANALARVEAGFPEWFTSPSVESYHSVWFELHEDLLATLNRKRGID